MFSNRHKFSEQFKNELDEFLLQNYEGDEDLAQELAQFAHPYCVDDDQMQDHLAMGCVDIPEDVSDSAIAPQADGALDKDFEDIFKIFQNRDESEPKYKRDYQGPMPMISPETQSSGLESDTVELHTRNITKMSHVELREFINSSASEESFSRELMRLVDEKELKDPTVYNRVFMDRRLFYKIKSNPDYQPSKETALRLSIGLHLTYEETQAFIAKAGYTMTHAKKLDVIIEFCMKTNNYDIMKINDVLDDYGLDPLL